MTVGASGNSGASAASTLSAEELAYHWNDRLSAEVQRRQDWQYNADDLARGLRQLLRFYAADDPTRLYLLPAELNEHLRRALETFTSLVGRYGE